MIYALVAKFNLSNACLRSSASELQVVKQCLKNIHYQIQLGNEITRQKWVDLFSQNGAHPMNPNDISYELKAIADNFEAGNYGVVVQQTLVLIEKKLREVIKHDLTQLESSTQVTVMKHLASKSKAIDDLTMGEIVGLLRETKFFEVWKQKFHRDLRVFETIDLNKLTNPLRNDVAHGKQSGHTREEAKLLIDYYHIVFQTFTETDELKSSRSIATKLWLRGLKKPLVVIGFVAFISLWGTFELANRLPIDVMPKEIVQLVERAERGDVNAQLELGHAYSKGEKVDKNYEISKDFFEKAAAQGDPEAMTALGIIYFLGRGVTQDYVKSRELFEKAVNQGYLPALQCLSKIYKEGLGVAKDEKRSEELLDKFTKSLQADNGFIVKISTQRMFNFDGYKGFIAPVEPSKSPITPEIAPNLVNPPEILPVIQPKIAPPVVADTPAVTTAPISESLPAAPEVVTPVPLVAQIPAEVPKTPTNQSTFTGCEAVITIPREECETLVKFYHSTNGDNWRRNTGWLKVSDPCQWVGVTCENGKVIALGRYGTLCGNFLKGSIPDLSRLKELRFLWLSGNQLTGTIPDLSQLEILNLSSNQLTGIIPNLSQLKILNLTHNQLTGTIPDLSQWKKLTYFNFATNQLTGTIPDLSHLKGTGLFYGNNLCRDANIRYPRRRQTEVNKYPLCSSK